MAQRLSCAESPIHSHRKEATLLNLSRKPGESVMIGDDIQIEVLSINPYRGGAEVKVYRSASTLSHWCPLDQWFPVGPARFKVCRLNAHIQVVLGIVAPVHISVDRKEIYLRKRREGRLARTAV
jgi:sRNA-binding carbon storage regulator CsrA